MQLEIEREALRSRRLGAAGKSAADRRVPNPQEGSPQLDRIERDSRSFRRRTVALTALMGAGEESNSTPSRRSRRR